jgi:hypothetical protein
MTFGLLVLGGFGTLSESWLKDKTPENCLTSVEIYDPETNSWTQGPSLPVPLCAMGVVKYYGTIYVLGNSFMLSKHILLFLLEQCNYHHLGYG